MNENNNEDILRSEECADQTAAGGQNKKRSALESLKYRFSPKKLKSTVAIIVVLAIVIAGGVMFLNYRSPSSIAERYAKAVVLGKTETMQKLSAYDTHEYMINRWKYDTEEKFFSEMSDTYKEDINSWSDYERFMSEQADESIIDECGDYKLSVEAKRTKDLSVKRILSALDSDIEKLEEYANFDKDSITDGKQVDVKVTIDGEDDTERAMFSIYMVKVDGQWKVLQFESETL